MKPTKEELKKEILKYNGLYSLKKYNINRKMYNIKKDSAIFFFRKDEDFNFWVKEYYSKFANETYIIKNILKDDNTLNYKVVYDINRLEDIFNMYILNNYNNYISIRNCSLQEILAIRAESQLYRNLVQHNIDITREQNIFKELKAYLKLNDKLTVKKLYKLYLKENESYNAFNDIFCWNYRKQYFEDTMIPVENAYNERDKIIRRILGLKEGTSLKNTSELILYKVVKDIFKDTIYQYRPDWLGRQSIDMYVPCIKTGIEYQGEQHYRAINFFGGKEQFTKQINRDERKRKLCEENGINLIYWKYDEKINTQNLMNKIKHLLR